MKKLTLKAPLSEGSWKKREYQQSRKKFNSIYIETVCNELKLILNPHCSRLRSLKSSANFIKGLHSMLNMMPLLESLELIRTWTNDVNYVTLPHLKTLKFENVPATTEILQQITDTPKLSTLEITGFYNRDALVNFLTKLPNLTSLKIVDSDTSGVENLFQNEIKNVPFKLEKLVLKIRHFITPNEQNLTNFLALHQTSMKHLSLRTGASLGISNHISNFVFTKFSKLESLEIVVTFLPSDTSFYLCLTPMDSVKKMKLLGKFAKHEVAKLFFSNFPALEDLDLQNVQPSIWSSKFLKTISSLHKNLQHLAIPSIFKGTANNLHFKNLKSLHIGSIFSSVLLLNFLAQHSELTQLTLTDEHENGKLSSEDVEKLMRYLPNLRHIHYKARMVNIKMFYDVICKNYRNLATITFEVLPKPPLDSDPDIVNFILPSEQKYRQANRYDSIIDALMTKHSFKASSILDR